MTAWELGTKTAWSVAGYLQLNGAAFYQDYSDKQVTTQILIDDKLAPRVTNASSAEIWGLELDLVWQPEAIDGLSLGASYTWLDATYQDLPRRHDRASPGRRRRLPAGRLQGRAGQRSG